MHHLDHWIIRAFIVSSQEPPPPSRPTEWSFSSPRGPQDDIWRPTVASKTSNVSYPILSPLVATTTSYASFIWRKVCILTWPRHFRHLPLHRSPVNRHLIFLYSPGWPCFSSVIAFNSVVLKRRTHSSGSIWTSMMLWKSNHSVDLWKVIYSSRLCVHFLVQRGVTHFQLDAVYPQDGPGHASTLCHLRLPRTYFQAYILTSCL